MNNMVSIIVPIFNAEKYIGRCIESILSQTYNNIELILVNDGSLDDSDSICLKYSKKDKRIKYFRIPNGGASNARNYGIDKSIGEYIMFVDADDSIENKMVETLVAKLKKYNVEFVVSGVKVIKTIDGSVLEYGLTEKKIVNFKENIDKIIHLFTSERINGPVAKLYLSNTIKKNNLRMPLNIHLNEDLNFNTDYLKVINSMYIDNHVLYNYYYNNVVSVTSRYYINRYEMLNKVNDNIISFFENLSSKHNNLGEIYYLYVKIVYSSFLNLFHTDCHFSKSEKINFISNIIKSNTYSEKIKFAKRNGLKYKLLLGVLKSKNKYLIYYFVKMLNFLRKNQIFKY